MAKEKSRHYRQIRIRDGINGRHRIKIFSEKTAVEIKSKNVGKEELKSETGISSQQKKKCTIYLVDVDKRENITNVVNLILNSYNYYNYSFDDAERIAVRAYSGNYGKITEVDTEDEFYSIRSAFRKIGGIVVIR